jgi:hypothetical protein
VDQKEPDMIDKKLVMAKNYRVFMIGIIALTLCSCKSMDEKPMNRNTETHGGDSKYDGSVFKDLITQVWKTPYDKLPSYIVDINRIGSAEFKKIPHGH